MTVSVNGVGMRVQENGFDQDYGGLGPAISITASAPNGNEQECYWWYVETENGSGVYEFSDVSFDPANGGHTDFCVWLQKQTGCEEEEALEAMEEIIDGIDTSVQFANDKRGLVELYEQDTTEVVLEPGTLVSEVSAKIFETNHGRYIGVINERGSLQVIAELSKEHIEACEEAAIGCQFGSYERWLAIRDAILTAVGIQGD